MPSQLYLVDLFGSEAAASALGANILLRSMFGAFLPDCVAHVFDRQLRMGQYAVGTWHWHLRLC
ncbi:hypothetical protein N7522_007229 [Penicillium canescens]|nr:hypothetical protein N7522_007229 [Penicillium canescens]